MKFGRDVCLGLSMCKTHFSTGVEWVAMVIAYYGKKIGGNLVLLITSLFLKQIPRNLGQMFTLGCRFARLFFFSTIGMCVAMVMAYYGKKLGETLVLLTTSSFLNKSHENWDRCLPLGVDLQDPFF